MFNQATKRELVFGLLHIGLDSQLHLGLSPCGGDDQNAASGDEVVRPMRHWVWLLRAETGVKRPVLVLDAVTSPYGNTLWRVSSGRA